jgi:NADPH:quinone reductase-like Zn-dependent oxidoreductase
MKALQITANNIEKLQFVELPIPTLSTGQALVKLKASALNHRDQWIREGKYPNIKLQSTLGSDGCGIVTKVYDQFNEHWLGKEVIINPNNSWGNNPVIQSSQYHILGMPKDGTFAEYIMVGVDRLQQKPAHLDTYQAASIPLGGLTAYRAIFTQGEVKKGAKVLISGIGGGVALFAFQFALALEANVYVTSSSDFKLKKAQEYGAVFGVNYKNPDWAKELLAKSKGFDVIIDSAGGESFNSLIKMLRPAGRLIFYGATQGLPSGIDLYRMFYNQIRIQGSTMGNDEEFKQMVSFIGYHEIIPIIDSVRPFAKIVSAFDEMKIGKQFGKMIIKIEN